MIVDHYTGKIIIPKIVRLGFHFSKVAIRFMSIIYLPLWQVNINYVRSCSLLLFKAQNTIQLLALLIMGAQLLKNPKM